MEASRNESTVCSDDGSLIENQAPLCPALSYTCVVCLPVSEKCLEQRWLCSRHLAGEIAAYIGRSLFIHQATILKERYSRVRVWCSQGHHLEGPVAIANDA
jgi:hypothetical protein